MPAADGNRALVRLDLGRVVATPALLEDLRIGDEPDLIVMARDVRPLLARHSSGDWGDCSDPWVNDAALEDGSRILSVYRVRDVDVWVMTDAASDVCPACWAGIDECEPEKGEWDEESRLHFRTDLPLRRLSTTVTRPADY